MDCKTLGRVRGFDETGWALVCEQIVPETMALKFREHRKLRAFLLQTGDALLVEAAPSDRVWGSRVAEQDALAYRFQWSENLLGTALMGGATSFVLKPESAHLARCPYTVFTLLPHHEGMTEQPVAWIAAGMVVREDGGSVTLGDIETVWEAMHNQLARLGLRVAGTRAWPVSRAEMESGDMLALLRRSAGSGGQPL